MVNIEMIGSTKKSNSRNIKKAQKTEINQVLNNLEKTNSKYNSLLKKIDSKLSNIKDNEELYYLYTLKSMYECDAVFIKGFEIAEEVFKAENLRREN